jgi:hypothetical protein
MQPCRLLRTRRQVWRQGECIQESSEGKVDLPEDDPAIVKLLIQYLYEGEYEPHVPNETTIFSDTMEFSGFQRIKSDSRSKRYGQEYTYEFSHTCTHFNDYCSRCLVCPHHICSEDCNYTCQNYICDTCTRPIIIGPASQTLDHAKMYEIADKYDVVGLKDLAREKFKLSCCTFWDKDEFSIAAHYAFSTTMADDKGLRDIISSTIADHMQLIQKPEIQALLSEHNGLSLGIMMKKADEHGWVKK